MNKLINIIQNNTDLKYIKKKLDLYHIYDIAKILPDISADDRKKIYTIYDDEELADIFSYLDEKDASFLFNELSDVKRTAVINEMEPDDITDVLQESTDEEKDKILESIDSDLRDDVIELNQYDESTAGSVMNTHFISVKNNQDIKIAMKTLVSEAPDVESINTIFVVNDNEELLGVIALRDLIISKSPCLVDDIMNHNFKSATTDTNIEEVIHTITDYDIYDLPILENGILKGIITMDDAIDNLVDEASEDYAKLAGLTSDEEKDETIKNSIKKRIPWLVVLLILDFFVPIISSMFDFLFLKQSLSVLIIFQPVILGLAGNFGMQSLGLAIRSISNKSLESRNSVKKYVAKEILLGVCMGIILGIFCFLLTWLVLILLKDTDINVIMVSLTIGISTTCGLIVSSLAGSIIPLALYKMNLDPAAASGPLITTIVDTLSVVIYFSIATIILYQIA